MFNTAVDGLSVLVEHENNALSNLRTGLAVRIAVARRARSLGELLRDQVDLLPDTHARIRRDHQLRGELLKGLSRDLRRSIRLGSAP